MVLADEPQWNRNPIIVMIQEYLTKWMKSQGIHLIIKSPNQAPNRITLRQLQCEEALVKTSVDKWIRKESHLVCKAGPKEAVRRLWAGNKQKV